MNKETLLALQGSIKKWEAIVAGTGWDKGANNCPLCQRFPFGRCHNEDPFESNSENNEVCPVALKAGRAYCESTPYMDWIATHGGRIPPVKVSTQEQLEAAKIELTFLKSLLPAELPRLDNPDFYSEVDA